MAVGPGALYLFNGDKTIVAVAPDGHAQWRYAPADSVRFDDDSSVSIAADSTGRVYAADLSGGRITVLSPLGRVERVFRIHNRPHVAPRGDGWFWGASLLGASPALFDTAGRRFLSLASRRRSARRRIRAAMPDSRSRTTPWSWDTCGLGTF